MGFGHAIAAAPKFRCVVPRNFYAVTGREAACFWDSLDSSVPEGTFKYWVDCANGRTNEDSWRFTPIDDNAGDAAWTLTVYCGTRKRIYTSTLHTVAAAAGTGETRKYLPIGDSVAEDPLGELTRLFDGDALTMTITGTQTAASVEDSLNGTHSVKHEGHGGWDWAAFVGASSPFYIGGVIDFAAYNATLPVAMVSGDTVACNMGINNMIDRTTDAQVNTELTNIATAIETLIDTADVPAATSIRGAVSGINVLLCPIIAPCFETGVSNQLEISYDRYMKNRWMYNDWLVRNYDTAAMQAKGIYVPMTHCQLNRSRGFGDTREYISQYDPAKHDVNINAVHPAMMGHWAQAANTYAILKNLG